MKCANCGEEIEEGMRFCGTCGAPVPQEKACVSCGAKIPLKMKFCPECGAPQDGSKPKAAAAIAMGDKNVIAGDVTGKKEEMNISGNAT
ncbi:MAG: zinc ribbon domain-containing protein, partial [Oscillospiraceae bacterium]|nr:zinc ribbon domain-containing protein [Oscillospiraceae bacterium]